LVTTAPTSVQVKGILWVELNKHFNSDNAGAANSSDPIPALPGRTNQTEWWIGTYLAGVGRKPSDYNPAGMQGLHAEHMLIIVDEAAGVTANLVDAVETLATNDNASILMIGNPDDPQSQFARIHGDPEKYGYHTIRITAADTPNFTDEHKSLPRALTQSLLSPRWVREREKAWGLNHPFYIAKVLAEFPSDTENQIAITHDIVAARVPFRERAATIGTVVGVAYATTASAATPHSDKPTTRLTVALGVDVAGSEHGDETVIREVRQTTIGHGLGMSQTIVVGREWRVRTKEPSEIASLATLAQTQSKATIIAVDTVGIGWGVRALIADAMKQGNNQSKATVVGINAAQMADNKELYANKRAEMWWATARDLFSSGRIDTSAAPNLEELEAQLLSARYKIVKGKIQVELKDDIRKRLGRSPDNADAFLLACAPLLERHTLTLVTTPQTQVAERHTWNKTSTRSQQLKLVKAR